MLQVNKKKPTCETAEVKIMLNISGMAAGTSVMGLLGGLLWWFVWWFWGIPALSVLPVVLMLGFLMSSILFYLPISFEFLTNDFNFWSAFCCCWLVLPVVFVTFTRLVSLPLLRV